ncbi:hypothetical protein [Acholeplasma granularum]|uniref:carboxylesterase family protein n=1 Tax=Acholeplasma granularum TaxID=264635 RepID=UPI000472C649|nr:hypothetical protein [Acholeplasma granularum]
MEINLTSYMTLETYENSLINDEVLTYRVFIPKVKRRKYKAFIFLHGSGQRGDDGISHIQSNAKILNYIIEHPIYGKETIIIAPQLPSEQSWVDLDALKNGTYDFKSNYSNPQQLLFNEFLDKELTKKFKIDPQFIYIGGISMGGAATIDFISRFPSKFAAAISICGTLDLNQIKLLRRTPLWLFHSSDDPVVNHLPFKKGYELLTELGADINYTEFKNTGHAVWDKAYEEPGLIDWIFSKKKIMPRF